MDLKKLNVQEMDKEEQRKTEGGWLGLVIVVVVVIIIVVINNDREKDN